MPMRLHLFITWCCNIQKLDVVYKLACIDRYMLFIGLVEANLRAVLIGIVFDDSNGVVSMEYVTTQLTQMNSHSLF